MNPTGREQELVDIVFSCVLTATDPAHAPAFAKMSMEERVAWVTKQLRGCGFKVKLVGSRWGQLVDDVDEET